MKLNRSNGFLRFFHHLLTAQAVIVSFLGATAHGASRWWDGGTVNIATTGNGASAGGAGNWDTTLANWDQGNALAHVAWNNAANDDALFAGTAGAVALTAPVTVGNLTFGTTGYSLTGTSPNILTFGGTTATITSSALTTAGTVTLSAPIAGNLTGGLTVAANGDLSPTGGGAGGLGVRLAATNTFTGTITVTSGLLSYTADAALGNAANSIVLNGGGILDNNTNVTLARNILVGAGGGTVRAYGATTGAITGVISGSGTLGRTDGGTFVFSGNNTFTGIFNNGGGTSVFSGTNATATYNVNAGTLGIGNNGTTGSLDTASTLNIGAAATVLIRRSDAINATSVLPANITIAAAGSRLEYAPTTQTATMNFDRDYGTDVTKGYFRVSGGTVSLPSGTDLIVDTVSTGLQSATNLGTLNILAGSTVTSRAFNLGETANNAGIVNQSGDVTLVNGNIGFRLGHWTSGTNPGNVYNLLGGTLDATALIANTGNDRYINIGWDGQADMVVGGGAGFAQLKAAGIQVDQNGDSAFNDTLTMSANGIAEIGTLGLNGASANDRVILNGGTLKTTADNTWNVVMNANAATTSAIDPNGFTLLLNNNLTGTGTIDVTALSGGSIGFTTTGTQTVSPAFTGSGPIRKLGSGTATFSGNSTAHIGTLTVEAGRLNVTGSISASTTTIQTGTVLGGEGTFTSDVYLDAGSKLIVDPATAGALTFASVSIAGQPAISFESVPTQSQSPITLFKHTGFVVGNVSTDLILPGLRNAVVSDDGTNVTVSFTNKNLLWNGTSGGQWDVGTSNRWNAGEADAFFWGDAVTFDDTGLNPAITLTGEIQPASVAINGNTNNYAFTGTGFIGGSGGITKTGTSTLTLGTPNTYTGATIINGGTLKLGNATALGTAAAGTTIASGAVLDVNGQDLGFGTEAITISGTGISNSGALVNSGTAQGVIRSLTLAADSTVNIDTGKSLIIGQSVGNGASQGTLALGSNTLTKTGAGELMLNGINLTSGNITVNAGVLTLMRTYTTGAGEVNFGQQPVTLGGTGTLTINSGATVSTTRWNAGLTISMPIVMNGGVLRGVGPGPNNINITSPVSLTANSTFDYNATAYAGGLSSVTFSGVISGSGQLTRIGGGADVSTLTATNTYTGGTMLTSGIVAFNSGSLGTTGAITMNGGQLRWNGTNTQDISNRVVMLAGKNANFDPAANNVTFGYSVGNATTAALGKYGTGILTLAPVNTYSGGTNIEGGTLSVSAIADTTGSSSIGTLGGTANYVGINLGSSLQYTGSTNVTTTRSLWIDRGAGGTIDVARAAATLTWTPGGGTRSMPLIKAGAGTLALNSPMTGTATVTVNGGTLALGGAQTYTGVTTVNTGGALLVTSTLTSDVTVATGGTLGGEGSSTNAFTLNEGSTLLANFATPAAQLTTSGAVTVNKTTSGVTVQLQNAPTTPGVQVVPILKYGTHTGGTTNFNVSAYRSASVTDDTTNKILSLNYTSDAKIWNGAAGNTTWDVGTSTDWTGGDLKFFSGDSVSFTDAATSKAVTLTGNLSVAQIGVTNTADYTFSGGGNISGSGALTKNGTAFLYLTNTVANTFSGGTTINAGTVGLGNNANENVNALGSGTVTINSGGKLGFYPGSSAAVFNFQNNIVLNGGTIHEEDGNQHLLGTVSVTADSTVTGRWNPKSIWFDGVVSGANKLTVTDGGNGAWVAFTNPFNSYSGTVALGSNNVNVLARENTTLQFATIDTGATTAVFQVAATNAVPNVVVAGLKGTAAAKVINADATARVLTVNNTADNSFAGGIGDGTANGNLLSLVKTGGAILSLGGASTYTGTTTVSAGTLIVNAANASSATTVAAGATLKGAGTLAGGVTVTGTIAPGNNAVGTLTAASATISGTYACEIAGTTADKLAVTGALTLSPGSTLAITTVAAPTVPALTIATYSGTVPAFTTVTGLPSGYSLDYSLAGQIRLVQAGFSGWVAGFGLTGSDALVGADPDHDGIPNGVEFVIGGNPATGHDEAKIPTLAVVNTDPDGAGPAPTGDYLKFTFRRTSASVAASVASGCEFDADLIGTWTTAVGATGVVQNVTTDGFGTGVDKVEVFVPKATWSVNGKLFGRLRVSVP